MHILTSWWAVGGFTRRSTCGYIHWCYLMAYVTKGNMYIICLWSVLVSSFYFQVPCWMSNSPLWAQPLRFTPLHALGVYLWLAYVQLGVGHQPTPGMHRAAAPSTTLSRGSLMPLSLLFPNRTIYMVGHTAFGTWQRVTGSLCHPYMVCRGLLFQVGSIQ